MDINQFSRNLLRSAPYNPYFTTESFNTKRFRDFTDRRNTSIQDVSAFIEIHRAIGNEGRTTVVIASVFWEIITTSSFFRNVLKRMKIRNPLTSGGRMILTMTNEEIDRYDLLVLSPDLKPGDFYSSTINELQLATRNFNDDSNRDLFRRWRTSQEEELFKMENGNRFNESARLLNAFSRVEGDFISDTLRKQDFAVLFAPMPSTTYSSSVGKPGCSITLEPNARPISSVGVVTTNKNGVHGVTASLHGVFENPNELSSHFNTQGLNGILNKTVYINGKPGTIIAADYLSDSCFIRVDTMGLATNSTLGPLQSRGPYQGERVSFESFRNIQSTAVTEVDIGITSIINNRQVRLYTRPVINPGDSGCALLNTENYVLGFGHLRTGLGEDIEFAEWIWADSVFRALELNS